MLQTLKKLGSLFILLLLAAPVPAPSQPQQGKIQTGIKDGVEKLRLAAPDFKPASGDPQTAPLNTVFNQVLWNDLDSAGIFEMVSKSFYPLSTPAAPNELRSGDWGNPPPNAAAVTFGSLGVAGGKIEVKGWLFDVKNPGTPQVLAKRYLEDATADNARLIAHRFANEIISALGGGLSGITETKIVFISSRSGHKEVWAMDYDGAGQRQLTHLNSIALSPHISPDNARVAFSGLVTDSSKIPSWQILMYSLDLGRTVSFPRFAGGNYSPAWSSDGRKIAFSSSGTSGDPDIIVSDAAGAGSKRMTVFKGPDVSPVWNPKTNTQIAWISGRNGLPQVHIMDVDGSNVQQITDQGYAVSPSWAPNGLTLAFAWFRRYGPGAPGAQDIYIMDIASRQFVQLTHDAGRNDFPSWSPDGRHIVFQSNRTGSDQIWTMLANGTHQQQLTSQGQNTQPNWSFK